MYSNLNEIFLAVCGPDYVARNTINAQNICKVLELWLNEYPCLQNKIKLPGEVTTISLLVDIIDNVVILAITCMDNKYQTTIIADEKNILKCGYDVKEFRYFNSVDEIKNEIVRIIKIYDKKFIMKS